MIGENERIQFVWRECIMLTIFHIVIIYTFRRSALLHCFKNETKFIKNALHSSVNLAPVTYIMIRKIVLTVFCNWLQTIAFFEMPETFSEGSNKIKNCCYVFTLQSKYILLELSYELLHLLVPTINCEILEKCCHWYKIVKILDDEKFNNR